MKTYTLQRFYNAAKALIEKHNAANPERTLRVGFELEDTKPGADPKLDCLIIYDKENFNSTSTIMAFGRTPQKCLSDFEDILIDKSVKIDNAPVSVELETSNLKPETKQP